MIKGETSWYNRRGIPILLFLMVIYLCPVNVEAQRSIGVSFHDKPILEATPNRDIGKEIEFSVQGNIRHIKNDLYLFSRLGVFYQPMVWSRPPLHLHATRKSGRRFGASGITGFYLRRTPVSGEMGIGYTRHQVLGNDVYGIGTLDINLSLDVNITSPWWLRGGLLFQTPLTTDRMNGFILSPSLGLRYKIE